MNKENFKENDILISTLINPGANLNDLMHGGVNATNTQLLTQDAYKQSDFIKKAFTNEQGQFDEQLFNQAYQMAANAYADLTSHAVADGYKEFVQYNPNDIYAPINAKKQTPTYNITRISNPYESLTGIASLFGTVDSDKSVRELAQKSKIYDSESGKYLDKSAEDLGLFGGLFSKPLVYAKWHEDGTHVDPITGRTVTHQKGEYRVNDEGKFFTETIGKREGYDEEFVALSDILTKEDSWLNKIDFFDSDDKEKSIAGIIAKTAVSTGMYLIPGVQEVWGAINAALFTASVLPTFAKAIEGLIIGDKNTGFTDTMSLMENYFKRFDHSISDDGQQKQFGLEQFGITVSDIFGQLYQMRAAANISKLAKWDYEAASQKAWRNFQKNHSDELAGLIRAGKIEPSKEGIRKFWGEIAAQTPELKALAEKQSKLARAFQMSYMAMLTSADVYSEALEGGYSRRAAGIASLASTLSQYYMMNTLDDRISSWFLDSVVGYNEAANRKIVRDALKPLWNRIETSVNKIPGMTQEAKQKEFAGLFTKIAQGVKRGYYSVLDGTSEIWSRALAEGIEEISEEAMMDATKGAFDALAYCGFLGDKNKEATFNTIENTFSKEGLLRYAQNALGGLLGGALFHVQENYIGPFLSGKKIPKATEMDLIKGIQLGQAEQYKELARRLGKRDNNVAAELSGNFEKSFEVSANGATKTRGEMVADAVIQHIEYLQGLLYQYDANLTPDELLSKVIRDREIFNAIKESDINNLILDDFDSAIADLAKIKGDLDPLTSVEKPTAEQEAELKKLKEQYKESEELVKSFLEGEKEEYYLKAALAYLNPSIRDGLTNISLYQYAKTKTGLDWDAISDKEAIKNEYEEWVNASDKRRQIKLLVDTMDDLEPEFSPKFKAYAGRYADVRRKTIENLIARSNFNLADALSDDNFQLLLDLTSVEKNNGLQGATLQDILQVDPESIMDPIVKRIYNENKELFDTLATLGTTSVDEVLKGLANVLAVEMASYPIETWNSERVNTVLKQYLAQINEAAENDAVDMLVKSFKMPTGILQHIASQALTQYILKQDTIDNELLIRLKENAANNSSQPSVVNKMSVDFDTQIYNAFEDLLGPDEEFEYDPRFTLKPAEIKNIQNVIKNATLNGISRKDMALQVAEELFKSLQSNSNEQIQQILEANPDAIKKAVIDFATDYINNAPGLADLNLLEQVNAKPIANNPVYDLLRELSFRLSPNVRTNIFDLLQQESMNLAGVYDISQYIKMPDVIEQIKNAQAILKIAKCILFGMEDNLKDPGKLFSYNAQVRKFVESFKEGVNAGKYETLDTSDIYTIGADLDLLISKLDFIERLSSKNTESQAQEDNHVREKFNQIIIDKLKANASKLQVNGVSIATPDDLQALEDDTIPVYVRIGRFQHSMFTKFKAILDSGTSVESAINTLMDNLGLDIKEICDRSLESARLNSNIKSITDYDFAVWLATTLGNDANEYYAKYQKYLQDNPDDSLVPLYIQELNTHIIYSALTDTIGVHNAIQKYIITKSGGYPADTKNITFVDGVSGSGKTMAIAKVLLSFTNEQNIVVAAPNNDSVAHAGQAQKLKEALGLAVADEKVMNKEQLLKLFITDEAYTKLQENSTQNKFDEKSIIQHKQLADGSHYRCLADNVTDSIFKDNVEAPKLLFIDEVTHFNTAELQILDKAAEKYGFKIIALGDMYQESANIGNEEAHIDQVFVWKGPRLGISSRSANTNKKDNIDRFQVALDAYYDEYRTFHKTDAAENVLDTYLDKTGLVLKYFEDNTTIQGDKLVDTITAEDLIKLKNASEGEKLLIITELDDAGEIKDSVLKATIEKAGLTPNDYELRSPDKIHPKAVQGAEGKYCVINIASMSSSPKQPAIKKLYTLFTRSQEGSLIKLPQDAINMLKIQNIATSKPGTYKLPGSGQRDAIKKERIENLSQILGSYTLPAEPGSNPPSGPKPPSGPTSPTGPLPSPANPAGAPPVMPISQGDVEDDGTKVLCYGFYTRLGLVKGNDSRYHNGGNSKIPLDLTGLASGEGFSTDAVQGFLKLKNLLSLYPDTSSKQFTSGLSYSEFTKQIATFIKELFPALNTRSNADVLKWLATHIQIDKTPYVVGVKMDKATDAPAFKFGFDSSKMVSDGNPLLLMARNITIKDDILGISFNRYITTGALAMSSTAANVSAEIATVLKKLEDRTAKALKSKDIVVYKSSEEFSRIGTADGRYVPKKNGEKPFFDSLQDLVNGGANIKEVALITAAQNPDNTYKFVEWARKFNPAIEKVAYLNDKFALAGRYMVRISYTNATDTSVDGQPSVTDHVFIVDLRQVDVKNALQQLKDITGDVPEKRKLLHADSYSNIVIDILSQLGCFTVKPTITVETILKDFKAQLEKNPDMHSQKIKAIDNYLEFVQTQSVDNLKKELFTQDGDIALLLTDWLIKSVDDNGNVNLRYNQTVKVPKVTAFTNVTPVTQFDKKGCCKVDNSYMTKLGLTTGHYEVTRFGISPKALETLTEVDSTEQAEPENSNQQQWIKKIVDQAKDQHNDTIDKALSASSQVANSVLDDDVKDILTEKIAKVVEKVERKQKELNNIKTVEAAKKAFDEAVELSNELLSVQDTIIAALKDKKAVLEQQRVDILIKRINGQIKLHNEMLTMLEDKNTSGTEFDEDWMQDVKDYLNMLNEKLQDLTKNGIRTDLNLDWMTGLLEANEPDSKTQYAKIQALPSKSINTGNAEERLGEFFTKNACDFNDYYEMNKDYFDTILSVLSKYPNVNLDDVLMFNQDGDLVLTDNASSYITDSNDIDLINNASAVC